MYKALVSFAGSVSMRKGEVREISDLKIAEDLIRAGYIVEVSPKPKKTVKATAKKTK